MTTVISSLKFPESSSDSDSRSNAGDPPIPPLAEPFKDDRKFFWQTPSNQESSAIATQVGSKTLYAGQSLAYLYKEECLR